MNGGCEGAGLLEGADLLEGAGLLEGSDGASTSVARELQKATGCTDTDCLLEKAFVADEYQALHGRHNVDATEIYGEVALSGLGRLLDLFEWGPDARFYDLGCGAGRLVLKAVLTRKLGRAKGIEKVSERVQLAEQALNKLETLVATPLSWAARPEFADSDFGDVDFSDATAIYMASVYFPDELMMALAHRFVELRDGARIASLVRFPFDRHGQSKLSADSPLHVLRVINKVNIPMSWDQDDGMTVFVYEVNRRAAKRVALTPLPETATVPEVLAVLGDAVVRADDVWSMDVAVLVKTLSSLKVGTNDELALFGTSPGLLALRTVLAVLTTDAPRLVAVSEDAYVRATVEDAIAALREFAPKHLAWHRKVAVVAQMPEGITAVDAGGMSISIERLHPGAVVAAYSGCLPGLPFEGDSIVVISAAGKDVAAVEAMGESLLGWSQVSQYVANRLHWVRLAGFLSPEGSTRAPASAVARWLRAAERCQQ